MGEESSMYEAGINVPRSCDLKSKVTRDGGAMRAGGDNSVGRRGGASFQNNSFPKVTRLHRTGSNSLNGSL
jgi:hypothetical protein